MVIIKVVFWGPKFARGPQAPARRVEIRRDCFQSNAFYLAFNPFAIILVLFFFLVGMHPPLPPPTSKKNPYFGVNFWTPFFVDFPIFVQDRFLDAFLVDLLSILGSMLGLFFVIFASLFRVRFLYDF